MSTSKHILILTADAGLGHRSAANAIAAALQETCGHDCTMQIVNPLHDERVPALLRNSQSDYDKIIQNMPQLYKLGYEASDAAVPSAVVESALTVMLFEVMRDIVRRHQPDAIVTTYPLYHASLRAVYALSKRRVPLITVVTDLVTVHRLWFHDAVDCCLVPTNQARELALAAGLSPRQVVISGIPVHPNLVRETRTQTAVRAELGWQPDLKTVLAVGSKRVSSLPEVLKALNHSGLPLQLAVVAGGDNELYNQLTTTEWHVPTHIYNFVANMPPLMHAADCIICKAGGLIVTESLACGLPLLLIGVLPGQEAGNATFVVNGGAGALVPDPLAALETLYHWLDHNGAGLAQRARNARRLGHPHAAYEIAEWAWAAAERGPEPRSSHRASRSTRLAQLLGLSGITRRDRASGKP